MKKGISAVVATVLMVLITIAGVVLIWTVVLPMIKENVSSVDFKTDLSIVTSEGFTAFDGSQGKSCVQVKRGADDSNINAIQFIFTIKGTTYTSTLPGPPEKNQMKTYCFNVSGVEKIDSISVAPVLAQGNSRKTGVVTGITNNVEEGDLSSYEATYYNLDQSYVDSGSGGSEEETCTDECSPLGNKTCEGNSNKTCGNYDEDSCLEWSAATACGSGKTCSSGDCVTNCVLKTCSLNYSGQCGSALSDGCGGTLNCANNCQNGQTCSNGNCVAQTVTYNSCEEAFDLGQTTNGIYQICVLPGKCIGIYCNMDLWGSASIFQLNGPLTLDVPVCRFNTPLEMDDNDDYMLWTDLSFKISNLNTDDSNTQNWMTLGRNFAEYSSPAFLPNRPPSASSRARPVPLPATNRTIWFDGANQKVSFWDGTQFVEKSFSQLGMAGSNIAFTDRSFYAISDGINKIQVGSASSAGAYLLKFNFTDNSFVATSATKFAPKDSGWFPTEEDAFGHILYTVNGRVMYYDKYYPDGNASFVFGGSLTSPQASFTIYNVTQWAKSDDSYGLDFFGLVDNSKYLWFADWGHDHNNYFGCVYEGSGEKSLGTSKTNIMLTY